MGQKEQEWLRILASRWEEENIARTAWGDMFIACFCPRFDRPYLWKEFGRDGTGFAIEFRVLKKESVDVAGVGFKWLKVDYSPRRVRERLESAFRRIMNERRASSSKMRNREDAGFVTRRALWVIAANVAAQVKSCKHRHEHEWRMIALRTSSAVVFEEPKRHICVPLRKTIDLLPDIKAIHIGRSAAADSEAEIDALLRELGYVGASKPDVGRSLVEPSR